MTRNAPLLAALVAFGLGSTAAAQPKPAPAKPTPAPTAAAPVAEPTAEANPEAPDVDALRQEYLKLRDELFESRARAATVASALYSTKISVRLNYTTGRFYTVTRAAVRLDGASVYDDTEATVSRDDAVRFEGWIAPGRHVLTIRIEATGKDDDRFTSSSESSVVVFATAGKDLVVTARARDGGDIPYEWKKSGKGSYQLGLDVAVKTVGRGAATGASRGAR